jgi:hypothetical protein
MNGIGWVSFVVVSASGREVSWVVPGVGSHPERLLLAHACPVWKSAQAVPSVPWFGFPLERAR